MKRNPAESWLKCVISQGDAASRRVWSDGLSILLVQYCSASLQLPRNLERSLIRAVCSRYRPVYTGRAVMDKASWRLVGRHCAPWYASHQKRGKPPRPLPNSSPARLLHPGVRTSGKDARELRLSLQPLSVLVST